MTLGTLEKLFPEIRLRFWPDDTYTGDEPVERQIFGLVRSLPPAEKARCLKLLAANFPDQVLNETRR